MVSSFGYRCRCFLCDWYGDDVMNYVIVWDEDNDKGKGIKMSDITQEIENRTDDTTPKPRVRFEDWVERTYDYVETNKDLPRMFQFDRDTDVNGVSGTGTVADGVQFSDGAVALHWVGNVTSTSVWSSMQQLITVHGHDGKSKVTWL